MARDFYDFSSSLNEVDNEIKNVLLDMINVADKRVDNGGNSIWGLDRIFMTTSDSLDEIKMSVQLQSDKSVLSFPFIAFSPDKSFESVDHAMGNRVNEAGLVINADKTGFDPSQTVSLMKSFQTKYTVSIWDETFKAIRYYQDKISLRCLHREFCHTWQSKLVDGVECNFTYFINMPVINTVPSVSEKVGGSGYIYCLGFSVDVWGHLLDEPKDYPLVVQVNTQYSGVKNYSVSETGEIK